jgi:uncharacterized protein (TIGR02680 family)
MLPQPASTRFQPLRSGLINLYKYEDQEFRYERGRLLLRGTNGSGKSRVLALQLPFLFDGDISPDRVEPDGDRARAMAWHLHMNEYEDRTGYTWIEFGRVDEEGRHIYVTLGCGMRAIRGETGLHQRWFFVTDRRVGHDLHLLTPHRQPLSRIQLETELNPKNANTPEKSALFKTIGEYRQEVDRRLFGLKDRYNLLIELLIRLRAPQLARKLDENKLSTALGDALPPLPETLLRDVADSFSNLDSLQKTLDEHRDIHRHISAFLDDYRRYLQIAILRRAEKVRSLHSDYESNLKQQAEAQRTLDEADAQTSAANAAIGKARNDKAEAEAALDALREHAHQDDADKLERAHDAEAKAAGHLKTCEQEYERRETAQTQARQALATRAQNLENISAQFSETLASVEKNAGLADWLHEHQKHIPDVAAWPEMADWHKRTRQILEKTAQKRSEAIAHLTTLDEACNKAGAAHKDAKALETTAESRVAEIRETIARHNTTADSQSEQLRSALATWTKTLRWIEPFDLDIVEEELARWIETGDGADRTLPKHLEQATTRAESARSRALEQNEQKQRELKTIRETLLEEQRDLEAGKHRPPAPPATRDPAARARITGAPLWQACDFSPSLASAQRAALEAALESSGLLDALITPDGRLATGENDTFILAPQNTPPRPPSETLARWLQPASHTFTNGLTADAITRALQTVAAGNTPGAPHWIDTDGNWQLGPLAGRGTKPAAQHLGEDARLQTQRARLAEIENTLADLDAKEQQLQTDHHAFQTLRHQQILDERAAAPSDDTIATTLTLHAAARANLDQARKHWEQTQQQARARLQEYQQTTTTRDDAARDLGLHSWSNRLDELSQHWQKYQASLTPLWPTAQLYESARKQHSDTQTAFETAAADLARATGQQTAARAEHAAARQHCETLNASVGATVAELQRQITSAKNLRKSAGDAEGAATQSMLAATQKQTSATDKIAALETQLTTITADRAHAIEKLRLVAHHKLFVHAHPAFAGYESTPWSPTRAIDIAREIDRTLEGTNHNDETWTRQHGIITQNYNQLQTALGVHGHQPRIEYPDDNLCVITCRYSGKDYLPLGELHVAIAGEITQQERLLTEKERELIDRHLIGEVAAALQTLIRDGTERVTAMNTEIIRCSTATGLTMRLHWEPRGDDNAPAGLAPARKILLSDPGLWTPDERTQLGGFLHGLIKDARTTNPNASWTEHLRQALDYRHWHGFTIDRFQNGKWERLTKRRYGTGSGGEKALMLTVPQMAAAASHYKSAAPYAPRLILLDEAFVGMSTDVRARCMGLLEAFDLDFVMTSEREWGAYSTIKGLAIYQLVTSPDVNAIGTVRWTWNGHQKQLDTGASRQTHDAVSK